MLGRKIGGLGAVLLAVLVVALLFCSSGFAQDFIGKNFDGTIRNGTGLDPVRTLFLAAALDTDDGGKIVGRYHYHDSNVGTKSDGEIQQVDYNQATRTLTARWKDRHGEGPVTFCFNSDYSSFVGRWGEAYAKPAYPWMGTR